jgi:hypothetical protein
MADDRSDTWSVDAMPSDEEVDPVAEVRAHEDLMHDIQNINLMGTLFNLLQTCLCN